MHLHNNTAGNFAIIVVLQERNLMHRFIMPKPSSYSAGFIIVRLFVFMSCDWLPNVWSRNPVYSNLHESDPCKDKRHVISSYPPCNYYIQLGVVDDVVKVWYATEICKIGPNAKFGKPGTPYRDRQVCHSC